MDHTTCKLFLEVDKQMNNIYSPKTTLSMDCLKRDEVLLEPARFLNLCIIEHAWKDIGWAATITVDKLASGEGPEACLTPFKSA